jgi:hypothetical protein
VEKIAASGCTSSLRGITLFRVALGVFVAGTAGLVFLAYWEYQRLIDYCADSPEVEAGGDKPPALSRHTGLPKQASLWALSSLNSFWLLSSWPRSSTVGEAKAAEVAFVKLS